MGIHVAIMAPPKDDRGDSLPSFSLWQKLQKVPLLLAWRESQPSDYLHRLMRPHIMSRHSFCDCRRGLPRE